MLRLYDIDTGDGPGLVAALTAPDAEVRALRITRPAADTPLFATPEGWCPAPFDIPAVAEPQVGPWVKAFIIPAEIAMHLEPGARLSLTLMLVDGQELRHDLPVAAAHPLWTGGTDLPEPTPPPPPEPPSPAPTPPICVDPAPLPPGPGATPGPQPVPEGTEPRDEAPTPRPPAPETRRNRLWVPLVLATVLLSILALTYLSGARDTAEPVARDDSLHLAADQDSAALDLFANDSLPAESVLLGCEGPAPRPGGPDGLVTVSRRALTPPAATVWTCRIAPGTVAKTLTSQLRVTADAPLPAPVPARPQRISDAEACQRQRYPDTPLPDGTNPPIACDDAVFLRARSGGTHVIRPLANDLDDGPDGALVLQDCRFPDSAAGLTIADGRTIALTDTDPERSVPLALRFTCTIRDGDGLTDRALMRIILEPRQGSRLAPGSSTPRRVPTAARPTRETGP